jgi:hypothetical protein
LGTKPVQFVFESYKIVTVMRSEFAGPLSIEYFLQPFFESFLKKQYFNE